MATSLFFSSLLEILHEQLPEYQEHALEFIHNIGGRELEVNSKEKIQASLTFDAIIYGGISSIFISWKSSLHCIVMKSPARGDFTMPMKTD